MTINATRYDGTKKEDSTTDVVPHQTLVPSIVKADEVESTPAEEPDYRALLEEAKAQNEQLKKKLGSQGNDLGEMRKRLAELEADTSLDEDLDASTTDDWDYYADPERVIQQKVDERLKPIEQQLLAEKQQAALNQIVEAHPDYHELVQDQGFRDWLEGSDTRMYLAQQAEATLSAKMAIDLMNMYKADSDINPYDAVARDREIRAYATESGRIGTSPAPTYNASELVLLQQRDPKRYKAMLPDIVKAYSQGRVALNK